MGHAELYILDDSEVWVLFLIYLFRSRIFAYVLYHALSVLYIVLDNFDAHSWSLFTRIDKTNGISKDGATEKSVALVPPGSLMFVAAIHT